MCPEPENDRSQQIQDERLAARQRSGLKHRPTTDNVKPKKTTTAKSKTPASPSILSLFNLPEGGLRDIAKGVVYGLLPALACSPARLVQIVSRVTARGDGNRRLFTW